MSLLEEVPPGVEIKDEAGSLPLQAEAGRFERVGLPRGTAGLTDVAGTSDTDVWMIGGGRVLRWNGARVTDEGAPRCFADACCGRLVDCAKNPRACKGDKPCQMGDHACANPVEFAYLWVHKDTVVAGAMIDTGGLTQSYVEARLEGPRRWVCKQSDLDDGLIHPGSETIPVEGASITLETPGHFVNTIGGYSVVIDGRRLALPENDRLAMGAMGGLAATAPDDLWLWDNDKLWRGDGLSWTPVRAGIAPITAIWPGEAGAMWLLSDGDGELVRWDVPAGRRVHFPVSGASMVLRGKAGDRWLVGKQIVYHVTGAVPRQVETPFEDTAGRAWLSPSGELWVVGQDRPAEDAPASAKKKKATAPAGAAYRFLPARRSP